MTGEGILKLKAEAEAAQAAADAAAADAKANPTDAAKAAAAVAADAKATEAWKAWKMAERDVPPVSPTDWRVILLGAYLALTLLGSVYLLAIMAMAEPPERTVGELRISCCGENNEYCPTPIPTPSPTPTPANTNTNSADNSNRVSGNTAAGNTNQANSNATGNTAANQTANDNSNRQTNAASNRANTNANLSANANQTPARNTNSETQNIPELTIPPVVCVKYFNRLSADGFLFLIVLFAGMVGAVTRGIFSFVRHHGVGDFSFSWTWFYLFLPFSGPVVSLFLYFIIRGGFYGSPVGKGLILNFFAFVALSTLSGLFAENAMEKLRQVAEVLLAKVPAKVENPKETTNKRDGK
ncbi:MAG TPA: hypothetical protein VK892_15985 [Pyrinomonadaceae bacterium]|nr:hypothetical protein [Pyrinomonadaceae bacterium]